ncbi:MAG TPA: GatB/YqeY domain-containing protein [Gaiellaceae bacterium]|nr:GatB/YqeY domain-containing protein [Gaiellaceae bacterium]
MSGLIERLEDDLTESMKSRDEKRRDAVRLILASLRSAEKDLQRPLNEGEELQVLQRERKKRQEAAEAFRAAGSADRAAQEETELAILGEYMPEPLSEEDLESIIDDAIAENGATNMRDLGRVMADVMPQVAGRADGSVVSQLVREKLA